MTCFLSKVNDVRRYINFFFEENEIKYDDVMDFINKYEHKIGKEDEKSKENIKEIKEVHIKYEKKKNKDKEKIKKMTIW